MKDSSFRYDHTHKHLPFTFTLTRLGSAKLLNRYTEQTNSLTERHEIDELVEKSEQTEASSSNWLKLAKELSDLMLHHLKKEGQGFFQMAGKILTDKEKILRVKPYLKEYEQALAK